MKNLLSILKLTLCLFSIFLISCSKNEDSQINVTEEVGKFEGFIASYDKAKEESKKNINSVETRASDAYIAKINAKLDELFASAPKSKTKLKYSSGSIAGFIETLAGCGGRDEFTFVFDCEDGQSGAVSPSNTIASTVDGNGNVSLRICAIDLSYFHRIRNKDYALLMLGPSVPNGISYFRRNFDCEDGNPANNILYNGFSIKNDPTKAYLFSPNLVGGNITLYFYFLPQDQNSSYSMPSLGRSYAVFGNNYDHSNYRIYTNDEDHANANSVTIWLWDDNNGYRRSPAGINGELYNIGAFSANTNFYYSLY